MAEKKKRSRPERFIPTWEDEKAFILFEPGKKKPEPKKE